MTERESDLLQEASGKYLLTIQKPRDMIWHSCVSLLYPYGTLQLNKISEEGDLQEMAH